MLGDPTRKLDPFTGLRHAQVLGLVLPPERYLIDDLIPMAAVGTIAGVPETFKSWLAQSIAVAVAKGDGEVLGRPVVAQGPVGYFWADDSTNAEAERASCMRRRTRRLMQRRCRFTGS